MHGGLVTVWAGKGVMIAMTGCKMLQWDPLVTVAMLGYQVGQRVILLRGEILKIGNKG